MLLTLISSLIIEGTVLMSVTLSRCNDSGNSKAFSIIIMLPPKPKVTNISKIERSKQIDVEAKTPENSCGENLSFAQ